MIPHDEHDEKKANEESRPTNKKSKLNFMSGIVPFFSSEWSFGRFKTPNEDNSTHQTCAFDKEGNHLIVVSSQGTYYLAEIPKSKGNCKIVDQKNLL